MNSQDRPKTLWKNLKERLRITGLACCGSSWNLRVSGTTSRGEDEEEEEEEAQLQAQLFGEEEPMIMACQGIMNLATALAAERRFQSMGATAQLKTLMRLFEETDDTDDNSSLKWYSKGDAGTDRLCCVCMERDKGAAFIPCGHTYCRVCSRELWLNRGLCPLCNRSINEILNIF